MAESEKPRTWFDRIGTSETPYRPCVRARKEEDNDGSGVNMEHRTGLPKTGGLNKLKTIRHIH